VSSDAGVAPIFKIALLNAAIEQITYSEDRMMMAHLRTGENGEFSDLHVTADGKKLVATVTSVMRPSEIELLYLDKPENPGLTSAEAAKRFRQPLPSPSPLNIAHPELTAVQARYLSSLNETLLQAVELAELNSFTFKSEDGTPIQGFLVKPPNFDPSKKYPVKFLIHGGPQGAWGDAWSYRWNPELFAAKGYVVVMINPRGSTGYGQRFLEEVSGDWGGRPYIDLMRGLDYAEQHYGFIDKNRECALGASYGGFMANWVLTHTNRFKCIVTHDGMFNPQSAFGDTEELWFNEWEFRPLAGARPDAVVEQGKPAHPWDFYDRTASEDPFRKWSPMLAIKNAHTPTLVVHSQRDMRLDVSEGLQLFTALQLLGVPSRMLYFPDEGHWILKPQNSQLWNETVNDWCDRWLGMNKYEEKGPEKNPAAAK
jgi:dipeptidyl aminopeptidase/acylaminoacyl peptidase